MSSPRTAPELRPPTNHQNGVEGGHRALTSARNAYRHVVCHRGGDLRRVTERSCADLVTASAMVDKWRSFSRAFARYPPARCAESDELLAPVLANGSQSRLQKEAHAYDL